MIKALIRAALVTTVAGTVLLPSAAFAARLTVKDPQGDSWEDVRASDGSVTWTKAGSAPNSDLSKVVLRHTADRVIAVAHFHSIARNGQGLIVELKIRTDEGLRRHLWLAKDPSQKGFATYLNRGDGTPTDCKDVRGAIDWAGDTATVSVSRACLSNPRWVKVTTGAGNYGDGTRRSYGDVAGTTGHTDVWSARVRKA